MCTYWSKTVPLAPRNPTNGGTKEKEGRNVRGVRKRDKEWTNRKECGGLRDSWDYCLLAIIVSG